jgi:hypothetical protein
VVDQTNQKQRTMQALADAAGALAANGCGRRHRTVSKITADLPDDPADRIDEMVRRLAEIQFGDKALWRAILRANLAARCDSPMAVRSAWRSRPVPVSFDVDIVTLLGLSAL